MNSIIVGAWHYYNDMCCKFSIESDMSFKTFSKEVRKYLETNKNELEKCEQLEELEGMIFDYIISNVTFDVE